MRLKLTARERMLLIFAAVALVLAVFILAGIIPLQSKIADARGQLSIDQANLQLALKADASAAELDKRLASLNESWKALQLPEGDHQAAVMRVLDDLQRRAGVRVDGVTFAKPEAEGGTAGTAGGTSGQIGLNIKFVGTPVACADFVARVEGLSDVVVVDASFATGEEGVGADTVGLISGYLVQAPR